MGTPSTYFGFDIKGTARAPLRTTLDWDYLAKVVDLQLAQVSLQFFGNSVISGGAPTFASRTVNVAAISGWANGVYLNSSVTQSYIFPGGVGAGTYKVFLTPIDKSAGTFLVTHGAVVPNGSLYICDATLNASVITSVTDQRVMFGTLLLHNHSGGAQGVQLTNTAIANSAAIAYSKLNLTGAIQYADLASQTAKIGLSDEGVSLSTVVKSFNFTGNAVVATVNGGGDAATIAINPNLDTLTDVTLGVLNAGDLMRYRSGVWVNEASQNTVSGTDSNIAVTAGGAEVKRTITHADGLWVTPPTPDLSPTGDDCEIRLDLGKPFTNTAFSVIIKNVDVSSPTNLVTLNWSRKGMKV